jgi:DNA-binding MarR family transcriptional regulator
MLNTLVSRGAVFDRDALITQLARGLDVNAETVLTVLHGLETRGLLRVSADATPRVQLTPDGQDEHRRLTAIISGLTDALYAGFDTDDLAVTRHVLVTLTERADAHVAATVGKATLSLAARSCQLPSHVRHVDRRADCTQAPRPPERATKQRALLPAFNAPSHLLATALAN